MGRGFHGVSKTKLLGGLARSFRLGRASFENVPVEGVPSLVGPQDVVIYGTNILERFLATLDYPRQRLILSPRSNAGANEDHSRLLPGQRTEVPFFLWGDHYLFARGGVGDRRDLNFFVDSGLVILRSDAKGETKQAAFTARGKDLTAWGVPRADAKKKLFDSALPLSLGSLTRENLVFLVEDKPSWKSFGGVRIDGLLSHGFLAAYAWTLDFERQVFVFSH